MQKPCHLSADSLHAFFGQLHSLTPPAYGYESLLLQFCQNDPELHIAYVVFFFSQQLQHSHPARAVSEGVSLEQDLQYRILYFFLDILISFSCLHQFFRMELLRQFSQGHIVQGAVFQLSYIARPAVSQEQIPVFLAYAHIIVF